MAASFKPASLSDSSDETDGDHEPARKGHTQTAKKWNNEPNRKKRQLSQNESSDTDTELHPLKRVKGPSQNDGYKRPNALPKSRKEGDSFGFGREMDGDHEPAKRYNSELSRKRKLPSQTDVYKEPNAVPKSRSESDGSSKGSPTKFSHFMPNSSEDDDEDARNSEDGGDASNQIAPGNYSIASKKMMQRMGYTKGKGLGKHNQGMKDIIHTSKQRGRRGLGLSMDGLEPSTDVTWDFEKEEIDVREYLDWMPQCTEEPPDIKELRSWVQEGKKKLSIDDETLFCDPEVLKNVLDSKNIFDRLEPEEMRRARTRSNPFETIRGGIFLNRAAMKMANIDCAFDFMFTNPVDSEGKSLVGPDELLYFADVCAGPGGFSEYVLWRKGWQAKGFGFTLRGPNDFKLEEFFAGPPDTFEPHYGLKDIDGDGDIYVPENVRAFSKFVKNSTDNKLCHFVMADGGFSVEGQENIQEILSKRLYLCQFYTALSVLREGGHFVCKLFDIFTQFSVGLVYLMYRAFEQVSIFKPNTSRPANSERYIVCKWRRKNTKDIEDYMYEQCCRFEQISSATSDTDIIEVVPLEILNDDDRFFNYILNSNNRLGRQQVVHLSKIKAFAQNIDLYEDRQSNLRKESLQLWKIPDQVRSEPKRSSPAAKFKELIKNETSYFDTKPDELTDVALRRMKSVYDYRCVVCGESKPNPLMSDNKFFFLGLGRKHVYQWTGDTKEQWKKPVQETLELPADTLFYGEVVQEFEGEGRHQKRFNTVHIIDALVLGKVDVRDMHYDERMKWVRKFVKAVSKPSRNDLMPLRAKEVFKLEDVGTKLFKERICAKLEKGAARAMRLSCLMPQESRDRDVKHFYPAGLLFFRTTKRPWHEEVSQSTKRTYYFNPESNHSLYERPKEAVANFRTCFTTATLWTLRDAPESSDNGKARRQMLVDLVNSKLGR